MRASGRGRGLSLLALSLAACMSTARWDRQESWDGKSVGSFPYHPLVYHLDLSILAYQLYSQTLVWPFDPYYEELDAVEGRRDEYMAKVYRWASEQGDAGPYRGPGALGGFPNNDRHDPILFRYDGLHPWSDAISLPKDEWLELKTPKEITGRIRDVYVCYRRAGGAYSDVVLEPVPPGRDDRAPGADDVLLAFEGGTGDKGETGQPASQSIMGFVLLRTRPGGRYDVHVAFRGSRSGDHKRAALEAHWDKGGLSELVKEGGASGNPDWITDMGYGKSRFPDISGIGEVHRGFAHAMRSILPKVFRCLEEAAKIQDGDRPVSIYVTGHSLGGALAQHFVSAVLLGDRYGPGGDGPAMPPTLRDWPWKQIKLITYSSPRAGDKQFARALTEQGLASEFFTSFLRSKDLDALPPSEPSIVSRLIDPARPAGYRVLDARDPATTGKIYGGRHVGKTVYVDKPDNLVSLDQDAHKPSTLRRIMRETFSDPRTPAARVWHDVGMKELNPERDEDRAGSLEEVRKRADAFARFCTENGIWFDRAAFEEAVKLRFAIDEGE